MPILTHLLMLTLYQLHLITHLQIFFQYYTMSNCHLQVNIGNTTTDKILWVFFD